MAFVQAKREQVWLKVLLTGASGSGKSFSALRLAQGIAEKCNSGIAYVGTEGSRDKYYADKFNYALLQLEAPYSTDKYIKAIDEAVAAGFKVLIIDSISHEWQWLNETHDKMPGNSFTNWGKLKPKHKEFMEKILHSPIHVICCARGKTEWTLQEQNGKQVPKKVGMGYETDKQISYEFTVSLMLDQESHVASTDKDNTQLFDGKYEVLTEKHGMDLYAWANDGEVPAIPAPKIVQAAPPTLDELKKEVIAVATPLMKTKKDEAMKVIAMAPESNPNKIADVETAQKIIAALKELED